MTPAKTLGVLGGLGPLATVYFTEKVIRMTRAGTDQEHIPMIIINDPTTPDRTDFILGRSEDNPLPKMIENAKRLESAGADVIVMPCNTAHYFYDEIEKSVSAPMINIVDETVKYAVETVPGLEKLGIMATDGTLEAGSYRRSCEKYGVECVEPVKSDRRLIMKIIYEQVKAGDRVDTEGFFDVIERLKAAGCGCVVLGCTELSVIGSDLRLTKRDGIVDSLNVLAERSIEYCGRQVCRD